MESSRFQAEPRPAPSSPASFAENGLPDQAVRAATNAPPTPPQSSRPRRRSILKTTDPDSPTASSSRRRHSTADVDDVDGGDRSAAAASRPPRRRVSFTSVDIQEHDVTLGDHPEVSWAVTLGWTVQRRHSVDIEDYEAEREPKRRPHQELAMSYFDRKKMIQNACQKAEDTKQANKTANHTRSTRQFTRSYANTPVVGKVEELLFSVTRKFKRAAGIKASKKDVAKVLENLEIRAPCDSSPDDGNAATEDRSAKGKDQEQESLRPVPQVAFEPEHKLLAPASA